MPQCRRLAVASPRRLWVGRHGPRVSKVGWVVGWDVGVPACHCFDTALKRRLTLILTEGQPST
eukprot:scaffold45165_cov66-Phaeocystis_antarctica.AAC.5